MLQITITNDSSTIVENTEFQPLDCNVRPKSQLYDHLYAIDLHSKSNAGKHFGTSQSLHGTHIAVELDQVIRSKVSIPTPVSNKNLLLHS